MIDDKLYCTKLNYIDDFRHKLRCFLVIYSKKLNFVSFLIIVDKNVKLGLKSHLFVYLYILKISFHRHIKVYTSMSWYRLGL